MNRAVLYLCCFLVSVCFISCENDDGVYPQPTLSVDVNQLDFGSYYDAAIIKVQNTGAGGLNYQISTDRYWLSSLPNSANSKGEEDAVIILADRSLLSAGTYYGNVTVSSHFGTKVIPVSIKVESYAFTFKVTNTTSTPMDITVGSLSNTLDPSSTWQIGYTYHPSSIHLYATTRGKSTSGTTIGIPVIWDYTYNVSSLSSLSRELVTGPSVFYATITNQGTHYFSGLYVNYGNFDQTYDNVLIPNDGLQYKLGYYYLNSPTIVRAYWRNYTSSYSSWTLNVAGDNNKIINLRATLGPSKLAVEEPKPVIPQNRYYRRDAAGKDNSILNNVLSPLKPGINKSVVLSLEGVKNAK